MSKALFAFGVPLPNNIFKFNSLPSTHNFNWNASLITTGYRNIIKTEYYITPYVMGPFTKQNFKGILKIPSQENLIKYSLYDGKQDKLLKDMNIIEQDMNKYICDLEMYFNKINLPIHTYIEDIWLNSYGDCPMNKWSDLQDFNKKTIKDFVGYYFIYY